MSHFLILPLLNTPAVAQGEVGRSFSVSLTSSRIIYTHGLKSGATIGVENRQAFPVLVKAQTYQEDRKNIAKFILTPPLFRLDAQRSNLIRVVALNNNYSPTQETLNWLCVTAMPPDTALDSNTTKVKSSVQVSVSSCIKLIYRPESLKEKSLADVTQDIEWRMKDRNVHVYNSSPFYINLSSASINGSPFKGLSYIPPFSSITFNSISNAVPGAVIEWRYINDNGSSSKVIQSVMK
ncbi:fimbria/pilus periplasmic chaperone [Serratia fonticola]